MTTTIDRRTFLRQAGLALAGATVGCTAGRPVSVVPRLRRIGYLSRNPSGSIAQNIDIVLRALTDLGYVPGRDVAVEARSSEERDEPLATLAAELVALPADVIMAEASTAALEAQKATTSIPIVFLYVNEPVEQGLVGSLPHPGANVTGVTTSSGALSGKRLELLKEVLPDLKDIAVIWLSTNSGQVLVLRKTEEAAQKLGIATHAYGVSGPTAAEFDTNLADIAARRPGAIVMLPNLASYRGRLAAFGIAQHLPHMVSQVEDLAATGALMGLGPDYTAQTVRAAALVDKILKGASPADVPVEEPSQSLFVVNVATARRLGLEIPAAVLRRATQVVE